MSATNEHSIFENIWRNDIIYNCSYTVLVTLKRIGKLNTIICISAIQKIELIHTSDPCHVAHGSFLVQL